MINRVFALVFVVFCIATGIQTYYQRSQMNDIESQWKEYFASTDREYLLLKRFRAVIGYGGMIHNFKNFLLRDDSSYLIKAKSDFRKAYALLDELQSICVPENCQRIRLAKQTVEKYEQAMKTVETKHGQLRARSLDALVRIDDGPALQALEKYQESLQASRLQRISAFSSEIESTKLSTTVFNSLFIALLFLVVYFSAMRASIFMGTLREQNKVLGFLQEETNDGWWDWKIQDDHQFMSDKFWQTLGYDPKTKKPHPSEWQRLIHPEDLELTLNNFHRHVDSHGEFPFTQEVRFRHANGHWVTIINRGKVVSWDGDGSPLRMIGSHFDITELKDRKEELSDQLIRYKNFFELTPVMMHAVNLQGEIVQVSDYWLEKMGYSREEVLGRKSAEFVHPDQRSLARVRVRDLLNKGKADNLPYQFVTKGGKVLDVILSARVERDQKGNAIRCLATVRDVTLENRQRGLLEESNLRYSLMTEGACVGIWDWVDVNEDSCIWSERFYSMIGHGYSDLPPSMSSFWQLVHPDDHDRVRLAMERHLAREAAFDVECRLVTKAGGALWFRNTGQAVFDEMGNPLRMVGSIASIQDLKKSQEEMEAFNYTVSHDLKTPVVSLKGYLGRLKKFETNLSEKGLGWIDRMDANLNHMTGLLRDLLDVSKANRIQLELQSTSLSRLTTEVLDLLQEDIERRKVKVAVKPLPDCQVDPDRLKQVLSNLIENAYKYNSSETPEIEIWAREFEDHYEVFVKDNGTGIEESARERIFNMFERGAADHAGSGLGLSICRLIIEKHQGRIWVDSDGKTGSVFTFTLPRSTQESSETA